MKFSTALIYRYSQQTEENIKSYLDNVLKILHEDGWEYVSIKVDNSGGLEWTGQPSDLLLVPESLYDVNDIKEGLEPYTLVKEFEEKMEEYTNSIGRGYGVVDTDTFPDDWWNIENYFGITNNINHAGYIDTNGNFIDFSLGGQRAIDHREIGPVVESYGSGTELMREFMSKGNIRTSPESGGLHMLRYPNSRQRQRIAEWVRHFDGNVILDLEGKTRSKSFELDNATVGEVMRKIDKYYES